MIDEYMATVNVLKILMSTYVVHVHNWYLLAHNEISEK